MALLSWSAIHSAIEPPEASTDHPYDSPPRVRGTRRRPPVPGRGHHSNPRACGEHEDWSAAEAEATGSTRACGEHTVRESPARMLYGSAPRVRGTLRRDGTCSPGRRFSPARAGNTRTRGSPTGRRTVQPRACGEHSIASSRRSRAVGSAPRVRGTHLGGRAVPAVRRFSPARAGNTDPSMSTSDQVAVQPRACGEHLFWNSLRLSVFGSAPRVRGTPVRDDADPQLLRFSPARAGNTMPSGSNPLGSPVQPRACGEHMGTALTASTVAGSAPRVRGTLDAVGYAAEPVRFSPARAGNTFPSCSSTGCHPVQPRACGEHFTLTLTLDGRTGSAPRVRGTPARQVDPQRFVRFSPARAGNTQSKGP